MGVKSLVRGIMALGELRQAASVTLNLKDPSEIAMKLLGIKPGGVAVDVTERTALTLETVWACVTAIAGDVSKVPLVTYREAANGWERAVDHPVFSLLHEAPHPLMAPSVFRETLTAHALTWGNGAAYIRRTNSGRPLSLTPLKPDRTQWVLQDTGEMVVRYQPDFGPQETYPYDDVLHIHGLGYDGLVGYSVIRKARESMGAVAAAERYGGEYFANQAIPPGVLTVPGKMNSENQKVLAESWRRLFGRNGEGKDRPAVLTDGVKFERLGLPNEDSQFLETRQFGVQTICRWFRVPPHKVFDLARATFSNIEHQSLEYVTDSLMTWMVRWEQECRRKLLSPSERKSMRVEHLVAALLRGDLKTRYESYAIGRQWGWLSPNDIRRLENMNTIDGGDTYLTPVNMVPAEAQVRHQPDRVRRDRMASGRKVALGARRAFADAYRRLLRVEADRVRRYARGGPADRWIDAWHAEHAPHIRAALTPIVEAVIDTAGQVVGELGKPEALASEITRTIVHRHVTASKKDILADGDLEPRLAAWTDQRPDAAAGEAAEAAADVLELAYSETRP
jgi:HK97 family phage portal protein